jgi:hypothetical protein
MTGIKRYVILLLVIISAQAFSINKNPDIKILESNSSGLTLEFIPNYFALQTITSGSDKYDFLDFEYSIPQDHKHIGSPDTRFRNITIGLPFLANNTIEILSADYETINNINYSPKPNRKINQDLDGSTLYGKNISIYGKNAFYPSELAVLNTPDISRDRIIGNLSVFPVQYNPVTKELRKYTRIRIRINFNGQNPKNIVRSALSAGKENTSGLGNIINDRESYNWRIKDNSGNLSKLTVTNSVLSSGDWYKIEIQEEGIIKLDAAFFKAAGIDVSKINPQTIKIYGNGGDEVPQSLTASKIDDLGECAIYVSGESDGVFDSGDYILFYGKGAYGWKYNSTTKKHYHYINHYSSSNYYFLTYGGNKGKRMTTFTTLNDAAATKVTSLTGKYYIEPEVTNLINSGKEWFGTELHSQFPSMSYQGAKLDGILAGQSVTYRVVCVSRAKIQSSFTLEQNSQSIGKVYVYTPADFSWGTGNYAEKSDLTEFNIATDIKDSRFNFKLTFNPLTTDDKGYLDYIEIFYPRSLTTTSDEITFNTPYQTGNLEYSLDGFSSSNIFVFKVDDHNNVKMLSSPNVSGGNVKFQVSADMDNPSCYYVTGNNGYKGYTSVKKLSANSNLHGITDGAEFIIITHPDFLTTAETYKTYREGFTKNSLKTKVINVTDIYNEFSGGLLDPAGIRDFLKCAYNNWTIKPAYVLLLGDGNYDYKNNLKASSGLDKIKVPVYETDESLQQIDSYVSDDFYVRLVGGGDSGYDTQNDLSIGRITVSDVTDAKAAIDKIKSYESNTDYSSWRNTITFVADDGFTSEGDDGDKYTTQSETLAESVAPSSFSKKKIFIVEYPTVIGFSGKTKPDANKAIINRFNQGTLIMNYIGHGNPDQWAHEAIFTKDVSIPLLTNKDMLTFIVAATCDFGRYDHSTKISGTEELLNKSDGGSIGTFCTSRSVFADENYFIVRSFYENLFNRSAGAQISRTSDIIYYVKQSHTASNDNKFHLIGDPTVRIAIPQYTAQIDSINGKAVMDSIQLKALSKVILKGRVLNDSSKTWKSFNGKVNVLLTDASKSVSISEGWATFNFKKEGGLLYNGEYSVKNGEFTSSFFIPKDISYENNYGKINLYFNNGNLDGAGYNNKVIVGGTDTTSSQDQTGPVIMTYLNSRNFRDGDLVGQSPLLIIDLFDESGINISGGVGHRFQAWIDNDVNSIDLSSYYKGTTDSYKEGTTEYELSNLSNGNHTIKVKSFDVFNNSSTSEINFKVSSQDGLSVQNVLNYPNPFSKSTKFTFEQNQDTPLDITIKIFTVSGRLIKTIKEFGLTDHFIQIEWDGHDDDGDAIANGIYLYKVITKTQDGKYTNETIGKLSILK